MFPDAIILVIESAQEFYDIIAALFGVGQNLLELFGTAPVFVEYQHVSLGHEEFHDPRLFVQKQRAKGRIAFRHTPLHAQIERLHAVRATESGRGPPPHRPVPAHFVAPPYHGRIHLSRSGTTPYRVARPGHPLSFGICFHGLLLQLVPDTGTIPSRRQEESERWFFFLEKPRHFALNAGLIPPPPARNRPPPFFQPLEKPPRLFPTIGNRVSSPAILWLPIASRMGFSPDFPCGRASSPSAPCARQAPSRKRRARSARPTGALPGPWAFRGHGRV